MLKPETNNVARRRAVPAILDLACLCPAGASLSQARRAVKLFFVS
jgi:hypothetical protein